MDCAPKQWGKGNFAEGDMALLLEKGDEMEPERHPPHTSTRSPDSRLALLPGPFSLPSSPLPAPASHTVY